MSEDCHDCFEPCDNDSGGAGGGAGNSGGGGTPNPRGPDGKPLPPWPAWLLNARVIGVDKFDGRCIGVGQFMNDETYTAETAPFQRKDYIGKRIQHSNDGLAMTVKVTLYNSWVTTRLSNKEEIAVYDWVICTELKLEAFDTSERPAYAVEEIPPFPYWFIDAIIVEDGIDGDTGMRARLAIGRNGRDGYMWVLKSLDSHEWFSYRYATPDDIKWYDKVFLHAQSITDTGLAKLPSLRGDAGDYGSGDLKS